MITSTGNQKVKEIIQLQKKSRARNQAGIFLVEGLRMIQEVPKDRLEKLYVSEGFYQKYRAELEAEGFTERTGIELVSDHVFAAMSDTKTPQGVLGIVRRAEYTAETLMGQAAPFLMVLDNLQDPGNLGTMVRTGEGAGITGVIMNQTTVDLFNPKTIRSTMGSIYRVPFFVTKDLPGTISLLKEQQVNVYAAHLKGTLSYDEPDYKKKTAFLIGNEGNGLSDEIADLADTYIKIPMQGQVESLNAAISASLLMYETGRQRRH